MLLYVKCYRFTTNYPLPMDNTQHISICMKSEVQPRFVFNYFIKLKGEGRVYHRLSIFYYTITINSENEAMNEQLQHFSSCNFYSYLLKLTLFLFLTVSHDVGFQRLPHHPGHLGTFQDDGWHSSILYQRRITIQNPETKEPKGRPLYLQSISMYSPGLERSRVLQEEQEQCGRVISIHNTELDQNIQDTDLSPLTSLFYSLLLCIVYCIQFLFLVCLQLLKPNTHSEGRLTEGKNIEAEEFRVFRPACLLTCIDWQTGDCEK